MSERGVAATLILVRHGESATNAANIFTGWSNPPLTARGVEEAHGVAAQLKQAGYLPDRAFASGLSRSIESARIILDDLVAGAASILRDPALNERDYGELTGMNKAEAGDRFGAEQVRLWRRSYAIAPPGGESLRDTAARVLAYYVRRILPAAMQGGATLIVAHGNSLRALIMALDGMTAGEVECFDLSTGATLIFDLAADTSVSRRTIIRN